MELTLKSMCFESELETSVKNIFLQQDVQLILENLDMLYVHEYNQRFCMQVDCQATRDRIHSFNRDFDYFVDKQNLITGRFNVAVTLNT